MPVAHSPALRIQSRRFSNQPDNVAAGICGNTPPFLSTNNSRTLKTQRMKRPTFHVLSQRQPSKGIQKMANTVTGLVHTSEAYNKKMVLERLGISQKFWDKMLDEGLPYTVIGHSRWVTGKDLIEHLHRKAERKQI